MRIGLVLSQTPGYSETFFRSKIKGLQSHGYTVQLYVQNKATDFTLCPVVVAPKVLRFVPFQLLKMVWTYLLLLPYLGRVKNFIQLEKNEKASWGSLLKKIFLNAHLLKANLDWLHFGFATQALGSECVAKAIGTKMAISFRGFDINVYPVKHHKCYNKVWKYVDRVHSISEYLYKKGCTLGLSEAVSYQIITPAVAITSLPKDTPKTTTFASKLQFVTIARLHWIKGLDTAIAAMRLLKKRGIAFQYHIIGEGSKKDLERYTFQVYEEKLEEEVVFHGKLSHTETLKFLRQADVYIQTSLNEGFCNAVLEAQALGILSIATNVGGLSENIVDSKTGWLVSKLSSEALAETLEKVLALPQEQHLLIAQNARERVQKDFNIEKQQSEFASFYDSYN